MSDDARKRPKNRLSPLNGVMVCVFCRPPQIITVEGPIASGKTAFAEKLAAELDMLYMPQATMDNFYINEYGQDFRQFDKDLPPGARTFDEKNFLATPDARKVAAFQYHMYQNRYAKRRILLAQLACFHLARC